ncbi:hypothetical protein BJ878DRAFT_120824 [Calycina marina]|uniref:Mid2 domain-containing protein n=1 Tax=Calycina marina TaxID=1763456 RepID=A0A9P7Z1V1_9HELO|nr:hypothetical protein BJ878DRAFT_120824 [Calycina marina]
MALNLGLLLWMIFSASFALGNDHFINTLDLNSQTASLSSYPVHRVGDILDVSWVIAAGIVDFVLKQLNSPVKEIDRTPNSAALTAGAYTWKITTDGSDGGAKFDLTFSNVFNFMAFKVNSTTITAQSAYFNISNSTVNQYARGTATLTSTSTTRLPISSMSLSSSSAQSDLSSLSTIPASSLSGSSTLVTTTTGTLLSKTSTSPTSSSTRKDFSVGAKVGLGIGLCIAVVAVITGFLIWFLAHKWKRNASRPSYDLQCTETSSKGKNVHTNWSFLSKLPEPAAQKVY